MNRNIRLFDLIGEKEWGNTNEKNKNIEIFYSWFG